jgi:intracellular septation protein
MKQFIDYIPLLVFFSVWALDERVVSIAGYQHGVGGIFSAAEFLLGASILVYGSLLIAQKKLDKFQWITLIVVILFCVPTIIFRDIAFLKWKAPIANWLFACVFFGSMYFGEKPAIEHMMGHAVKAPKEVWIQFKVFGNLILTFAFVLGGTMPVLAKYIKLEEDETSTDNSKEFP